MYGTEGLIETAKEFAIVCVAYALLGHDWLVDTFDCDDFAPEGA